VIVNRGFIALLLLLAAPSHARDDLPTLDPQGRAMLDPIRKEALRPEQLVARLGVAPTATIADIGSGPGFLTLPLAKAVPRGRVIAADIRDDYLAVVNARAARAGLANVRTRRIPPERPGLEPASLDIALLCQVDHYLRDRAGYLAALVPLLRRDGRVVLINYQRYRAADEAAARQARLRIVDDWAPSPGFFMLVFKAEEN
jgi:SAM-dependent methyltransferase